MQGKLQTQKFGLFENFAPKNIGTLQISYQENKWKLCFRHKLDGKRLILRYYRTESRKHDNSWNFSPPQNEKLILQILHPKKMYFK